MGGNAETCRSIEWLLRYLGSEMHYCGPLGSGQVVKLVNNMVSCANAAILAEAFAIADKAGADLQVLTKLMPGTAADSWQLRQTVMRKALQNDFSPAFKLSLAHKDMRLALDMANDLEATSGCIRGALAWYDRAAAAGYGELDRAAWMLLADRRLKKP
jgi:3-hydroxyisobutyrate dehydrogenase-like beta-hydroxyacid dehydrogenase